MHFLKLFRKNEHAVLDHFYVCQHANHCLCLFLANIIPRIIYIHHIFSSDELKKRIFKNKSGKIKYRLVLTSFLTTLLPLSIVVAYLLMSMTSLNDIGLYEPTRGELKVVFGQYYEMIKDNNINELTTNYNLKYINVIDTFLLFLGIGAGIFVTIIYVLLFVHWTNSDII